MNFQIGCQEDHQPTLTITDPIGSVRTLLENYPKSYNKQENQWVFPINTDQVVKFAELITLFESDSSTFVEELALLLKKL